MRGGDRFSHRSADPVLSDPGSPTVAIDDVDAHLSLAANGGFEVGSAPWGTYPGTNSSYGVYSTAQVTGPAPPPVASQPPPPPPPVTIVLPRPRGHHLLRVRISLRWSWRYALTRLDGASIGRFPHRTRLTLSCRGRGCPRHLRARTAAGPRGVHRLLVWMRGKRFRAGSRLLIALSAPGYRDERAEVMFRYDRLPRMLTPHPTGHRHRRRGRGRGRRHR